MSFSPTFVGDFLLYKYIRPNSRIRYHKGVKEI